MVLATAVSGRAPLPPEPRTYFVAPTGRDDAPGTETNPFQTVQRAADLVNPGDTVIVEDGIYMRGAARSSCGVRSILCIHRGGTAGAMVTFKARNPSGAKLDGRGNADTIGVEVVRGAGYVVIDGFEIYGVGNAAGSSSGIELYSGGAHSRVQRTHIHDIGRLCTDTTNGQVGVFVSQPDVTITGNVIHDIGRFDPGTNGCTPATRFYENHDHGVYADGKSVGARIPGARDLLISNNVFYNHRHGWALQIYPGSLSNVVVVNNTFAFPNPYRDGHIILSANTTNTRIVNNIFYQPRNVAVVFRSGLHAGVAIANNISSTRLVNGVPSGARVDGNLEDTDPQLASPTLPPLLTSPAIDGGASVPEVQGDIRGIQRPQHGRWDVGAYESNQ
jgi:hypothetical protein